MKITPGVAGTQSGTSTVRTTRFGQIEVPRAQVISFPLGLAGFEAATTFALLELEGGSKFRWLQGLESPEVGFVVVEAQRVVPDYPVDQVRRSLEFCELERDEEIVVLAICRIPPAPETATVNLQAPIGIGLRSRRGAQVLLRETTLTFAMPLRV
jgi:flagellar assembly factor FliW